MRVASIFLSALAFAAAAQAQTAGKDKTVAIGPWQIEANFTDQGKFGRCAMSRTTDAGVEARFIRDEGGLALTLSSSRWELEKGKNYPVEFVAGTTSWKANVAAAGNAVRVALADTGFVTALKNANMLEARGAGATIKVPLAKSAAALERLESCYETNSKALESNPFVKPSP